MFKDLINKVTKEGEEIKNSLRVTGANATENLATFIKNMNSNGPTSSCPSPSGTLLSDSVDSISITSEMAQDVPLDQASSHQDSKTSTVANSEKVSALEQKIALLNKQLDRKSELLASSLAKIDKLEQQNKKLLNMEKKCFAQEELLRSKEVENNALLETVKRLEEKVALQTDANEDINVLKNELLLKSVEMKNILASKSDIEKANDELNTEIESLQKRLQDFSTDVAAKKEDEKVLELIMQNKQLAQECTSLKETIASKDNEIQGIRSKFHDYEVRSSQHNQKIAILEKELSEVVESAKHYKEKMGKATSHSQSLNHRLETVEKENQDLKRQIADAKIELKKFENNAEKIEEQLSEASIKFKNLEGDHGGLLDQLQQLQNEKNNLTSLLEEERSLVASKQQELELQTLSHEALHDEKRELDNQLQAKSKAIEEKEEEVKKLRDEIIELKSFIDQSSSSHVHEVENLRKELSDLQSKILELCQNKQSLEKELRDLDPKPEQDEGWESSTAMDSYELLLKDKDASIEKLHDKIASLEIKVKEKEAEIEHLFNKDGRTSEDKLIYEYKREIDLLETELSEKNAALEEVHQHYKQIVDEKETQLRAMHQEFNSSSVNEHSYQVKAMQRSLLQYQEENLRLKELLELRSREEAPVKDASVDNRKIPEPTEFEYLKNIMFEYMMGREPMTLAKVIAAVLRFSNDQTEQVIKRQESVANPSLMPLTR